MAHLDLFAVALNANPSLQGFIIGYNTPDAGRGWLLREGYGYIDYMVNSRGVQASRLRFIEAEVRASAGFELWLLPIGAGAPVSERSRESDPFLPQKFDSVSLGPEGRCVGELFLYRYKLEDSLKFFGEALRQASQAKGWIVIHPRLGTSRSKINQTIARSRNYLIRNYNIEPQRILTAIGGPRSVSCTDLNLWVAPSNCPNAHEALFYSELIREAERSEYQVRRVEFVGLDNTRDELVRKRFVQQEGDIFSRRALETSLKNFNRLERFHPLTLNDVEVDLNCGERMIDITIYFRERPGGRRGRMNR